MIYQAAAVESDNRTCPEPRTRRDTYKESRGGRTFDFVKKKRHLAVLDGRFRYRGCDRGGNISLEASRPIRPPPKSDVSILRFRINLQLQQLFLGEYCFMTTGAPPER